MIGYFDTSSIVPLLVREPSTSLCTSLWADTSRRLSSRITYVEAHAAVSAAQRSGRLLDHEADTARTLLEDIWAQVLVIELSPEIASAAAACARMFALRGFDAIHCASALEVGAVDTIAVSGDRRLLDAWLRSGLAVADTSA